MTVNGSPHNATQHSAQQLAAGAAAGLVNVVLFQPLEVAKTRLQQTHTQVMSSQSGVLSRSRARAALLRATVVAEGPTTMWRGSIASALRNVPGFSCYLAGVDHMRNALTSFRDRGLIPSTISAHQINIISGGATRAFLAIVEMPITVVKVRFESSMYRYASVAAALRDVYLNNGGIRGLFVGLSPTVLRDAPFAAIYVPIYEHLKTTLPKLLNSNLTATTLSHTKDVPSLSANFISGLIAGSIATAITNPFDVVKTRVQLWQPNMLPTHNISTSTPTTATTAITTPIRPTAWQTFKAVYITEGPFGFTSGMLPRILKKSLSSATAWAMYEQFLYLLK